MDQDFAEYVAARRPALVRAAALLGCPVRDAEDLTHTALIRCYRAWHRVQNADDPDAYVYRILVNCVRDSRARRWNSEVPSDDLREAPSGVGDLPERVVRGLAVRQALMGLSTEHREVLVLRFYLDLSERQVVEILRTPAGTVKSRTARAMAALAASPELTAFHEERRR